MKDAGDDALSTLNSSAEVSEKDYKEGQLRKAGQRSDESEDASE